MKVCNILQTLRRIVIVFGVYLDLLLAIALGRAVAHPRKDCESFSHAALPVPTCGKPVAAEPAFSRPREMLSC